MPRCLWRRLGSSVGLAWWIMIVRRTLMSFLWMLWIVPIVTAGGLYEEGGDRQREMDQAIVGDTAVLLEKGDLEITLGVSVEDDGDQEAIELFVEIEYGVTDGLEIGMSVPYLRLMPEASGEPDVDGLGDVTLSVSVSLLSEHPFLISSSLGVSLDTADRKSSNDLGEGTVLWEPSLVMDVSLGDMELIADIGGEFGHQPPVFVFEFTLAYAIGEVVSSVGVEGSLDGDEKDVALVPGVGFPIAEDVELAVEVPIGLTKVSSDWKVELQLTFEY